MTISVVIADESDLALAGIRSVLDDQRGFEVSGSCLQLAELVRSLTAHPSQVILLSDRLEPDLDVLALVERVREAAPQACLIVLGSQPDGLVIHELLNVGVMSYLYKHDLLSEDLIPAVKTVLRGRPYLSPTANAEYLLAIQAGRLDWQLDAEARDVLRLLAQGSRPQEIALIRGTPVRRIYWVNNKLRRRFGAETNEHLIARAAEEGFVP